MRYFRERADRSAIEIDVTTEGTIIARESPYDSWREIGQLERQVSLCSEAVFRLRGATLGRLSVKRGDSVLRVDDVGPQLGDYVDGPGIPLGTQVVGSNEDHTYVMSAMATMDSNRVFVVRG